MLRTTCRSRLSLALVALVLAGATSSAASAQGIDFGAPAGEDVLLGTGSVAVSGGERAGRGSWRDEARQGWRDGDWGNGWHSPSRPDRRRDLARDRHVLRTSPSVIVFHRARRPAFIRGTGIYANAQGGSDSVLVYARPGERSEMRHGTPGPRIINVASERLDRQPIDASGLSVNYVGSTKIIRVAAGYGRGHAAAERPAAEKDMAALPAPAAEPAPAVERAPAPLPEAAPRAAPVEEPAVGAPEAAAPEAGSVLEPWTDEWLADCVVRHESFDATLGTYTEDGRRRFCTGEPA